MSSLLSSKRNPVAPETSVDVIRCGTAEDVYCLEMSGVANVKPAGDLSSKRSSEPHEPLGFMEHRGQKAPVFDLPSLLGISRQAGQTGHYVVLIDHPRQTYGIRVASVSRVIRLAQENVLPLPKPLEHMGGWFEDLTLLALSMNGQRLPEPYYTVDAESLTIHEVPERFTLEIVTRIQPERNTALEGLYVSNHIFCTQCEAEGFGRSPISRTART
jgi:chemotaxis signal transduction protein